MSRARSLPEGWNHVLAIAMDTVRVNTVALEARRGVSVWHKQRRFGMGAVIAIGNVFLHLSHSRIRMHPSVSRWRDGELAAFALLHPGRLAEPCGGRAVVLEALPGERLDRLLQQGRLTPSIMEAAARELHRAHGLTLPGASRAWSHGDAHLKNLLYDESERRAWLIDFETEHDTRLDASERHADDLLVLLLDLRGRAPLEQARSLAEAFLRAYPEQIVRRELMSRLCPPRGLERALWSSRSNHLPDEALVDWLEYLRTVIDPHRLICR